MIAHPEQLDPPPGKYLVRHGAMRFIGEFAAPPGVRPRRRDAVIVRTDRGQEVGEVLCPAVAAIPEPTKGDMLRVATADDRAKIDLLRDLQKKEFAAGGRLIAQHKLAMQLVDVEHLFGGERIVFYFLAENRVDFRELVKS